MSLVEREPVGGGQGYTSYERNRHLRRANDSIFRMTPLVGPGSGWLTELRVNWMSCESAIVNGFQFNVIQAK